MFTKLIFNITVEIFFFKSDEKIFFSRQRRLRLPIFFFLRSQKEEFLCEDLISRATRKYCQHDQIRTIIKDYCTALLRNIKIIAPIIEDKLGSFPSIYI